MRISVFSVVSAFIFAGLLFGSAGADQTDKVKHEYVGAKKCKICHKKDGIYPSWAKSRHAIAWDSLSTEKQQDEKLKFYYTTGTTAKGELLTGVQCEVCHGPGSNYKKKTIMQDRKLSVANGLIIPDETTCKKCHHDKAPAPLAKIAKDFDFEKAVANGVHQMHEADTTGTK